MNEESEIIKTVKQARISKGLSQRALSKLTGVTQAHISNIENGGVDIQLSSLTQIARALNLEVKLVPRKSLPAVDTIIKSTRSFPRDRTNLAISEIQKTQKILNNNIFKNRSYADELASSFENFNKTLSQLKSFHYDTNAFTELKKALAPSKKLEIFFQNTTVTKDFFEHDKASKEFKKLFENSNALEQIKNNLINSQFDNHTRQLSLYSLEDHDD